MTKLWDNGKNMNEKISKFTVGNDHILDLKLVKFDCKASIAHGKMLNKIGILTDEESDKIKDELNNIIQLGDQFKINLQDEDCHTAIENHLVDKLGDLGKKIHTARSRNDQVLTAIRLFEKHELKELKKLLIEYEKSLHTIIIKNGSVPIPGYTHMQKAMPTDINTWLGSFAASNQDNIKLLDTCVNLIDQNPLGTAAGFGVPLDINRDLTTKELNFNSTMHNPMYAQLSRGKFESTILHVLTQILFDINKLATDLIMFSMKEFNYLSLPEKFCTGSSIMPQKKNPDVLELLRSKYHIVTGEEFKVKGIISNLISGYNRDLQLTKEPIINSFKITKDSLKIITLILEKITINPDICKKAMTEELYATEEAYKLVKRGIPFRDAYKQITKQYN